MLYDDLIERLTVHYAGESYHAEVGAAKKEFFDEAGIIDEESPTFEMRMTQFLEWYLFTRPLTGVNLTPAQDALQSSEFKVSDDERKSLENLAHTRHSLFEFLKIRGEDIYVKDLFAGKKLVIKNSPIRVGFSRDEIFDTRLIPHEDTYVFLKGFCFHPAEASKFIMSEIKKVKKADPSTHEALMVRLLKMRYKFEQYRHLKLEYVYTNDKKVRF